MLCLFCPTSINKMNVVKKGLVSDDIMLVDAKEVNIYPHHTVNLYANVIRFVYLIW
jgi:hypothetical protein